jgi:hypothetical protein
MTSPVSHDQSALHSSRIQGATEDLATATEPATNAPFKIGAKRKADVDESDRIQKPSRKTARLTAPTNSTKIRRRRLQNVIDEFLPPNAVKEFWVRTRRGRRVTRS